MHKLCNILNVCCSRWEIFFIHTHEMEKNGMLSADVDLWELATNTSQFSGAEIAGVVRLAASYALDRKFGGEISDNPLIVSRRDFQQALMVAQPAHTQKHAEILEEFLHHGFINCSTIHNLIQQELDASASSVKSSTQGIMETVLLYGPRGTGKSGLAANLAISNDFTFVKVISPSMFVNQQVHVKLDAITDVFHDAFKSEYSLVILDSLHHFLEVVTVASDVHASLDLLNKLGTLLTTSVKNRMMVVGTLYSGYEDLSQSPAGQVGLQEMFRTHHYVPLLDSTSIHSVLNALNITNTNGTPLVVPTGLTVSLQDLLRVSDCFHFTRKNDGDRVPQIVWERCFKQYTGKLTSHSIVQ